MTVSVRTEFNKKFIFRNMYGNQEILLQYQEETNHAIRNGIYPILVSQGSSGSYFCRNVEHKMLGIFKPKDEEPYSTNNPKWLKFLHRTFLWCCFGREGLILNIGYLSEAGASLLDSRLGLNIVPTTLVMQFASPSFHYKILPDPSRTNNNEWDYHLEPKVGSMQYFVEGFQSANIFLRQYPLPDLSVITNRLEMTILEPDESDSDEPLPINDIWSKEMLESFLIQFQKMVILDYVIRNTDRGFDNWLLKLESNSVFLAAIDNGLAFPYKHPDFIRSYPYGWAYLPIANIPFLPDIKSHVLSILEKDVWWRDTKDSLHHLFSIDSEFDDDIFDEQMALLRGQLWNLFACLRNDHQSPNDLIKKPNIMVWSDFVESDDERKSNHSFKEMIKQTSQQIKSKIVQKIRRIETVGQAYFRHW
eukprot:NODE_17_length_48642_cov_1.199349.p10 type:complete len:418 gc:universal NODE_17_length_48642_cov_1.199349:17723-16470(-)